MDKVSTLEITRLGDSASYLAAIVESSDDAIISKNLNGIITSWNAAAERIFGYSAKEAIGKPISIIIPRDRQAEEDAIISKIRKGARTDHYETVRIGKDGRPIDLSITVSPIHSPSGEVIGASKVARDITAKKRLEKELQEKNARLEIAKQEMEDITHIASHDLKEPVRGLIMQAEIIKEDFGERLGPNATEQLDNLVELSRRSYALINDLLQFSRLGKLEFVWQDIDVNEVVRAIEETIGNYLKEKNARIRVPRTLPRCRGDKTVISEILRNLIVNAVTYNDRAEPTVEIGYLEEHPNDHPEKHVFYVRDNGIGIAKESFNEVFGLFKRLPTSKKFNPAGTGSGLTIIKKLTERCHGRVWIESEPGKGSTFFFTVCNCAEFQNPGS